jgi:hypothetical protein
MKQHIMAEFSGKVNGEEEGGNPRAAKSVYPKIPP